MRKREGITMTTMRRVPWGGVRYGVFILSGGEGLKHTMDLRFNTAIMARALR